MTEIRQIFETHVKSSRWRVGKERKLVKGRVAGEVNVLRSVSTFQEDKNTMGSVLRICVPHCGDDLP